jgi:hypothetical protein
MSELLIYFTVEELIELIKKYSDSKSDSKLPLVWKKENNSELDDIIEPYEHLMDLSLVKIKDKDYLENLIESFFICLDSASVSFDDLYNLYI